ncbi:uncharacterized protein LOC126264199 [Aethina tumida]|uniref:uncharacterized protein LOC109601456 n=1 Tax=Aethina tumida TaxID=116153 RepID=UPI00096B0F65|nr:uncharacterized protein LOC109601456 [Aethina tumida]XP_049817015.1 uncharacterized protein LOC126264199 [Aethina tumida]
MQQPNPNCFSAFDGVCLQRSAKFKKRMIYLRNPISGSEWSFWPDARFYYHYKIYRPLPFYDYYYPRTWLHNYWPSYRSMRYFLSDIPTEKGLTDVRMRNQLYWSDSKI